MVGDNFQYKLGPPDTGFSLFLAERTKKIHFIRHGVCVCVCVYVRVRVRVLHVLCVSHFIRHGIPNPNHPPNHTQNHCGNRISELRIKYSRT